MLERVLGRLLASRLDKFVDGLDEDNLRVAIWKGEILLENLHLKAEAVDDALGLPVGLAWGSIGTLHLSIPWNALGAIPLSVTLKDVTLVFRPLPDADGWNEEEATRRQRRVKERIVQDRLRFLRTNQQQQAAAAGGAAASSASSSLSSRLVNSLLSSVLVCLSGVNIRYECPTGPTGGHAAVGVTLTSFQISNDGSSGGNTSAADRNTFSKRATASGLALYCDPDCSPLSPSGVGGQKQSAAPHRFVLHPTSATISLHKNSVPTATAPQLSVDVQLARLHVAISESQLDRLNAMQASFKAVRLREEVSRWRPRLPPSRDPRAWWRYAYQCIRSKQGAGRKNRPLDWPRLVSMVTRRQRYIKLYKRRVAADLYTPLSTEEADGLLRMEDHLHVTEIVYFRTLADAEVSHEEALAEARKGEYAVMGWVRSAVRSVTGARPSLTEGGEIGGEAGVLMSEEERRALHEAIEYDATIAQATVPDHYSIMEVALSLNEGTLSLLESETRPVGRLILDATLKLVQRPHSWTLDAALGALEVFDLDSAVAYRTVVTTRRATGGTKAAPMMRVGDYRVVKNAEVRVDFNTSGSKGGRELSVLCTVFPFQIYYSRRLVESLQALLTDPEVKHVRSHAVKELREWRARQQARIYESIVQRQKVFLSLQVQAPVLFLPEAGEGAQRLLIVDLGELSLRNEEEGEEEGRRGSSRQQQPEGEDRWSLCLANMQVGLCSNSSAFLQQEAQAQGGVAGAEALVRPIIEAFDLNFTVRTWVHESSHSLARIDLDVCLPRLAINLTASAVQFLHRSLSSSSRGTTTPPPPLPEEEEEEEDAVVDSVLAVDDDDGRLGGGGGDGSESPTQSKGLRTVALGFRAPDTMLRLQDDLQGRHLVDVAMGGLAGSVESRAGRVGVTLQVIKLAVTDQHTFADSSFVPLLSALPTTSPGAAAAAACTSSPPQGDPPLAYFKLTVEPRSSIDIEVSLRPLQLQWNPETIAGLQAFFAAQRHRRASSSSRVSRPASQAPPPHDLYSPPSAQAALSSSIFNSLGSATQEEEDEMMMMMQLGSTEPLPVRLTAHTGQLTLLLNKEGEQRRMLDLTIGEAEIRFQAQGKTKELVGRIHDLRATDLCNLGTVYPNVLHGILPSSSLFGSQQQGQPVVIDVKYVSRPAITRLEPDNLLEIDVSPLEVVYFNQYCLEVIDYLCEGVLGDAITGTIRSADSLVRQKVDAKTAFRLNISRPRLIAPRVLRCPHHAVVTVKEATLTTVFDVARAAGEDVVMRHLVIGLQDIDLQLVSPPPVSPSVLAQPLVLTLEVSRALDPDYAALLARTHDINHVAALTVKGRVADVRLEATPSTHAFLRRIVDDNLMTSRHHAEEALRALRVVDLKPRLSSRSEQQQHHLGHPLGEGGEAATRGEEDTGGGATPTGGVRKPKEEKEEQCCPQCGRKKPRVGDGALLHTCPQCETGVCRRCLAISVFDKASGAVCRICRLCAAQTFPLLFSAATPGAGGGGGGGGDTRVAYTYGLTEGVRLTEIKVVIELVGPEVVTLDEESKQSTAQLQVEDMRIMWHRSEENRKILDVSLYGCSIRDVVGGGGGCSLATTATTTSSSRGSPSPLTGGLILSPHSPEDEDDHHQQQQQQPSSQETRSSRSPQLVYRHSSSPLEASSTSVVLNHVTIVVLFTPLLRIYRFFTDLGPDPLPATATPGGDDGPEGSAALSSTPTPSSSPVVPAPSSPGRPDSGKFTGLGGVGEDALATSTQESQVVDRIKIMVHHPRIIFPEAEDDVSSLTKEEKAAPAQSGARRRKARGSSGSAGAVGVGSTAGAAIVVRGLGVATYVREVELRGQEVLPRTAWSAELSRLECFICNKDTSTGQVDLASGVSLLNPVSCSLLFNSSYSLLRSPLRLVHLSIDSILTMYLSYLDVHTFTRVLEGWYRANIATNTRPPAAAAPPTGSSSPSPAAQPPALTSPPLPEYYEVTFHEQKLGLTLRRMDGLGAVVDSKEQQRADGEGDEADLPPYVGDVLVSVGGQACDHAQAVTRIRSLPRPLSICFRRRSAIPAAAGGSSPMCFKVHLGLEEVVFHRSKVPDCVLVVDKALAEVPPTAMVMSVGGHNVEGLGYNLTMEVLRATPSPTTIEVRHLTVPPPAIDDLQIQVAGVSILAIDDCDGRDLPLLRAQASEGQAFIRRVGQGSSLLKGAARLELLADYYNGRIAVWEPLLERVQLTGSLKRLGGPAADTVVRLTAAGPVNLTVTDAALELLLHTREEWLAQQRDEGQQQQRQLNGITSPTTPPLPSRSPTANSPPRPSSLLREASSSSVSSIQRGGNRGSPYVLKNLTGLPITFWTVEQESASGSSSSTTTTTGTSQAGGRRRGEPAAHATEIEAMAGSRVPFSVWQPQQQSHVEGSTTSEAYRREYQSVHTVFVRLSGPAPLDDAELTCLPMTKVGNYTYSLRPSSGGGNGREKTGGRKEIVWSVAVEAGRRILTLRSALEVSNKSGIHLQFRCQEETLEVSAWSTFALPLPWLMDDLHPITLRVAGSQTHGWSQSLFRPKGDGLKEFVTCGPLAAGEGSGGGPSSPSSPASLYYFFLDDASNDGPTSNSIMTVNVSAGVTFVNLLPVPLRYAWREGGGARVATSTEVGTVDSGEERAAAKVPPLSMGIEMCFKLDAFCRSEWVPLAPSLDHLRWSRRLKLRDDRGPNQGDALCVLLDITRSGRHAVTATVSVEFWLENLSGLPLVYGEPVKAAVETLAGPVTSEVVIAPVQDAEVVEEVFEVRVKGGRTRWGTELGRPLAPKDAWGLPCASTWRWADDSWKVDLSGGVESTTGWETSRLDYPDAFRPGRTFKSGDRIARRRWVRKRVPITATTGSPGAVAPTKPPVVLFQPRATDEGGTGTQLAIKAGDSCWSSSLDVGLEGAGGAFQVIANRWPNLDDQDLCRTLYELTYSVRAAPAPWDRTRIVSFQSRYTIRNDGASRSVCVAQAGLEARSFFELGPGTGQSFHWPDFQRDALLVVSLVDEEHVFQWSGPVDIGSIADMPVVVRGSSRKIAKDHRRTADGGDGGAGGWEIVDKKGGAQASSPKGVKKPWNSRIVRVQIELGGSGAGGRVAKGKADRKLDKAAMTVSLTEVTRVEFPVMSLQGSGRLEGRAKGEEDLPLIWLENATHVPIFYGQVSCAEEDELSPMTVRCFGWDRPMGEGDVDQEDPYQIRMSLFPGADTTTRHGFAASKVISPNEVGSMVTLPLPAWSASGGSRGLSNREQRSVERWAVQVLVTTDGPSKVLRLRLKDLRNDDDDDIDVGGWGDEEARARRRAMQQQQGEGRRTPQALPGVPQQAATVTSQPGGGVTVGGGAIKALVTMPRVVISVVDDKPEEVLVLGLDDVALEADNNWHQHRHARPHGPAPGERRGGWRAQVEVGQVQVDNHQSKAHFPVVLRPADMPDPNSTTTTVKLPPCIRLSVDVVPRPSLVHLRALRVAFRKFVLNLDQSTVHAVAHLAVRTALFSNRTGSASTSLLEHRAPSTPTVSSGDQPQSVLVCISRLHPLPPLGGEDGGGFSSTVAMDSSSSSKGGVSSPPPPSLFVEVLQVEALSINLSLSRPRESDEEDVYVGLKLNRMLVDMMHRVDEARLKLHPFVMMHMITTPQQMWSLCTSHYSREVKRHIFSMLGSLRALGKPVALIRGFGKGASDFIHEPFQGLVRSVEEQNPEEFVYGVARGGTSLLRHTLGGVANSASCITDNISKQMSNLAFDREYKMQRERREARKDKPADVLEGLGSGGKRLAKGLVDGVFGVVSAPIRGAERDGLRGLVKGMGKGMIGLVVKPVVGLTDAATDVLRGVQSTTGASTADQLAQLRPKRATYGSDRRLGPYELVDAQAQLLLARAGFGGDLYEDHADLGSSVALISTQRIIFLDQGGAVREVLSLMDVLFVEPVERLASEGGLQPRLQTGAIIHSNVKLEGGEVTTRRLYVPCDTVTHSRSLKSKVDQALLASQTAGLLSWSPS